MFLIMTIEQVIHILRLHQKWRRGAINKPQVTAKEYGEALDEAIRQLSNLKQRHGLHTT
jgi:hypothetical protein